MNDVNEAQKAKIRAVVLECYGLDIKDAVFKYSTNNYAYIFPGKPFMVRISMTAKKTRHEILSELMWVDDLKAFKKTICEPSPSLKGNILEEFEMDGKTYRASMFRTARGNMQAVQEMTPMYFVCVGDLLGTIHAASIDQNQNGIHYKRKAMKDIFARQRQQVWDKIPEEIKSRILSWEKRVNALPETDEIYGLCHGDFHPQNFFVETNNIWVFDFDECVYTYFMYDIATFIQTTILQGFGAGQDLRQAIQEKLLPHFKYGYELSVKCEEEFWELLELFLCYRSAFTYMCLFEIDEIGVVDDLEQLKGFFAFILSGDDIIKNMEMAIKNV